MDGAIGEDAPPMRVRFIPSTEKCPRTHPKGGSPRVSPLRQPRAMEYSDELVIEAAAILYPPEGSDAARAHYLTRVRKIHALLPLPNHVSGTLLKITNIAH